MHDGMWIGKLFLSVLAPINPPCKMEYAMCIKKKKFHCILVMLLNNHKWTFVDNPLQLSYHFANSSFKPSYLHSTSNDLGNHLGNSNDEGNIEVVYGR